MITLCFSGVHELVQPRLLGGAGEESAHVLQPVAAQLLLVAALRGGRGKGVGGLGGCSQIDTLGFRVEGSKPRPSWGPPRSYCRIKCGCGCGF